MNTKRNILSHLKNNSMLLAMLMTMLQLIYADIQGKNRCYSCASENMKENFLTRSRGPQGRLRDPKIYDSMCDLDSWLIREKSTVECQGACFKWQQVLNNSGVLSYATIRDCYERMFDPSTGPTYTPGTAYTTDCKHLESPLTCLDQSSIEEHTCFCNGDFCNYGIRPAKKNLITLIFIAVTIVFFFFLNKYF